MRGRVAPMTSPSTPRKHVPRPVPTAELDAVAAGRHQDPHRVLGGHLDGTTVTVRVLRPLADAVTVVTATGSHELTHEHEGVWAAAFAAAPGGGVPDYPLRVTYGGTTTDGDDPYRFLPGLGEMDLHLITEGRHEQLWTVLGANVRRYPGELGDVVGTLFAVWAPNAAAVRVVGDFNHWQGAAHAMR